jgi:predicted O-linked N-acetylglucosamine transferase (SPINDLY family)
VAGSLLTALDVPELITYSLEDYYNLALQLATDVEKMAKVRKRILDNRDTMPLFDTKRFTRNLEEAFDGMIFSFKNPNNDAGIN